MESGWKIFKKELKEYWKEAKFPTLSFLKLEEGLSLQKLSLLAFIMSVFSTCIFGWYVYSKEIPYLSISWNIHIISFFAFLFSLMFCLFGVLPLILYGSAFLKIYKKDDSWCFSGWIFSFGPALVIYFLSIYFLLQNEVFIKHVNSVFLIIALMIICLIFYGLYKWLWENMLPVTFLKG